MVACCAHGAGMTWYIYSYAQVQASGDTGKVQEVVLAS